MRPLPIIDSSSRVTDLGARLSGNSLNSQRSPLAGTPCFPADVYEHLPQLLQEGSAVFQSGRERDVFLISALAVLSGCMPTIRGQYDGADVWANLYAFVVAPAGSGKGALTWARRLGHAWHLHRTAASNDERVAYDLRVAEARMSKAIFVEEPPPYKSLYLPGNSSAAAFIKALQENDQTGLICETEADTLSGALKQDWGDYSDLLRKAFHHEAISYARKSGERYELERPALSVVLAGTPGQVARLIPDAENGLFSRFLFYTYAAPPQWRNVAPRPGQKSFNDHFDGLAERVKTMALALQKGDEITFRLAGRHWTVLNNICAQWLSDAVDETGAAFSANVFRLGLVTYRLAMVLAVIRAWEAGRLETELSCDDQEIDVALLVSKTLLEHGKVMVGQLPGPASAPRTPDRYASFLALLPADFTRQQAEKAGASQRLKERSVTNYLNHLQQAGRVEKLEHGRYQKT